MVHLFGDFELDSARGLLTRAGRKIALKPVPLALLALLVSQRGRIVSKQEMISEVWRGRIVSDDAISTALRDIRRVLRAEGADTDLFRTHYGQGVEFLAEPVESRPAEVSQAPDGKPYPRRLAVLPFKNLTSDPQVDPMATGLAEDIIAQVARFDTLAVLPAGVAAVIRTGVPAFGETASRVGIDYFLDGSIRRFGDRIRISAQLVHIATQTNVWSDQFAIANTQEADEQDKICTTICNTVVSEAIEFDMQNALRKPEDQLDAYECFLRGRAQVDQFKVNEMADARRLLQRAVDLDSELAEAYAFLAYSIILYEQDPANTIRNVPPHRRTPDRIKAKQMARETVTLDPKSPVGWVVLSRVHMALGEFEDAVIAARKALSLNPNLARAEGLLGFSLCQLDRAAEAVDAYDRALANSPQDRYRWWIQAGKSIALTLHERYDDAIAVGREAQLHPRADYFSFVGQVCAFGHLARVDEASRAIKRCKETDPKFTLARVQHDIAMPVDRVRTFLLDGLKRAGLD